MDQANAAAPVFRHAMRMAPALLLLHLSWIRRRRQQKIIMAVIAFAFPPVEDIRFTMERHGDSGKKIGAAEFGRTFDSANASYGTGADAGIDQSVQPIISSAYRICCRHHGGL
ncbi:MAG: hypothetical protein H6645_05410 [Caldilineaceae bacterium]|nr:hypothetical protein [Caldilineaceae bacterium]